MLVPKKGLEPPHPCEYMDLNHARLPIPPLRHSEIQRGAGWAAVVSLARLQANVNPAGCHAGSPGANRNRVYACRLRRVVCACKLHPHAA